MARKLKVFRTPIGFHDAYVAAPSRKAALEAWGADANLFARGIAEEVTSGTAPTEEALAHPGRVIRAVRGTVAEHMAALPEARPRYGHDGGAIASPTKVQAGPRPKRDELDAADAALGEAEEKYVGIMRALSDREAALSRERRQAERDRARSMERLERARDEADARYKAALTAWRNGRPG